MTLPLHHSSGPQTSICNSIPWKSLLQETYVTLKYKTTNVKWVHFELAFQTIIEHTCHKISRCDTGNQFNDAVQDFTEHIQNLSY